MRNNNGASVRRLSDRSLRNNRMRNIFAVAAIALTGILFTAVFSMTGGAMQAIQESTMREVGGRYHAGLKAVTGEQYEKVCEDPSVRGSSYTILIGIADNIVKRQAEIRYTPEQSVLEGMFITLEEGRMPEAADEIIADTFVLEELGEPCELGAKIPICFSFMGEEIEKEFTLCGFYQGDSIAHASELFVSECFWKALKGSLADEDFVRWKEEHPEDAGMGLIAGNLYFEDTSDLEGKVRTAIANAGYEPDTEVAYGVNWAYMESRMAAADPLTVLILLGAVIVILLTGYLIIYNIFQISVVNDIRFYGLLKTIGTTERQIRRMVRRQAVLLSVIGIPVGLFIGFGIGRLLFPFMLRIGDYGEIKASLEFHPWIFVSGALFSALTVCLSSRKPGKIAGSVSPVEALRYAEPDGSGRAARRRRKKKRKDGGAFGAVSMALSDLSRNRSTVVVVISAMSLSIIFLTIVMTAVGSFRVDRYVEQRIAGDFLLGHVNITSGSLRDGELSVDPEFLALADAQEGIEERAEMWLRFRSFVEIDEKAQVQLNRLKEEGKLRQDPHFVEELERKLQGEKEFGGIFYGYDRELLSCMTVLDGRLDIDRFMEGGYVLLTPINGLEKVPADEHVYHPGDAVTVERFTEGSVSREIRDASGVVVDMAYDDLEKQEYEVMAIVEIPYSMDIHTYAANDFNVILPPQEFEENDDNAQLFAVSYRVAEEKQEAFEEALRSYTEQNGKMGYVTKEALRKEFENMTAMVALIGITLSTVVVLVGILNFSNAMITQILSRKREFAMLQSIGMTNGQLQKMLICEGISYVAVSGTAGFVLGSALSFVILGALGDLVAFFEYRFQILPFVIMLPVIGTVAVLVPVFAWHSIRKKSIVERLREAHS